MAGRGNHLYEVGLKVKPEVRGREVSGELKHWHMRTLPAAGRSLADILKSAT